MFNNGYLTLNRGGKLYLNRFVYTAKAKGNQSGLLGGSLLDAAAHLGNFYFRHGDGVLAGLAVEEGLKRNAT